MSDASGAAAPPEQESKSDPLDWWREVPEELDPELEACRVTLASGTAAIKNAYCNILFPVPELHHIYNAQYAARRDAAEEARSEGKWHTFVFMHERPWRSEALLGVMGDMEDNAYWDLLGSVWVDSENIHEWGGDIVRALLLCGRHGRRHMMDKMERRRLAKLPEKVRIYRGHMGPNAMGWSWTTDRLRAEWFGRRRSITGTDGYVRSGRVRRGDVIAYLHRRNESEVVVNPADVLSLGDTEARPA